MELISVVLCDDMPYVSQYFKKILEAEKDIQVVGIARTGQECIEMIEELSPNVVLLDMQLSYYNEGVNVLKEIIKRRTDTKVIMVTVHEEDELIFECFAAGAVEYILKSCDGIDIVRTVRSAHAGNISLNPIIARKLIAECSMAENRRSGMQSLLYVIATLTAAEFEILKMVYDGKSYEEIARQRFVEPVTIRTQVNKILKKFNAKNMKQLIDQLKKLQLFDKNIMNP